MRKGDISYIQEHLDVWEWLLSWRHIGNLIYDNLEMNAAVPIVLYEVEDKYEDYVRNDFDMFHNMMFELNHMSEDDLIVLKELMRIKKNLSMRKYRYKKILRDWLNSGSQVVFLTLTFNDEILSEGFDSCRKRVNDWLNANCIDYMANDDYGAENARLHYHAIAILESGHLIKTIIDEFQIQHYNLDNYDLGYSDVQMVIRSDQDNVVKYFNKIINHSLKSTAASEHNVLRPRKKRKKGVDNKKYLI